MIRIKRVTNQNQMDAVVRLDKKIFNEDWLDTLNSVWWLVYDGKTPVGYGGLVFKKGYVSMTRSGFLVRARGLGLQRRLLAIRERHAQKLGYRKAKTEVANWNWASMANLIKCGYRFSGLFRYTKQEQFYKLTKDLKG